MTEATTETTATDETAPAAPATPTAAVAAAETAALGATTEAAPAAPDYKAELPDFVNDKGELDVAKVKEAIAAAKPAEGVAKAEDISWELPKDIDPDNPDLVYEIDKSDPMVQAIAPELVGLPQEKISALTAAFAKAQLAEAKQIRERLVAEEKKLGPKMAERLAGAEAFVASVVGKERAASFRASWITAEQVEVIEALAKRAGGPEAVTPENPDTPQSPGRVFYAGMKK